MYTIYHTIPFTSVYWQSFLLLRYQNRLSVKVLHIILRPCLNAHYHNALFLSIKVAKHFQRRRQNFCKYCEYFECRCTSMSILENSQEQQVCHSQFCGGRLTTEDEEWGWYKHVWCLVRLGELLSESQRSRWGRIHHTANVMLTSGKCQTFASRESESSQKY